MTSGSITTAVVGTVGGLAACALALQATQAWHASDSQAAIAVAVAAAVGSVVTIRGAIQRFESDVRWRRWYFSTFSILIAGASALAAAAFALVASHAIRMGTVGKVTVIAVAAVSALVGAVSDAYSDDRAFKDKERQKRLADNAGILLMSAFEEIKIAPWDLEVILMLKTRSLLFPWRDVLRLAYSLSLGGHHKNTRLIGKPRHNKPGEERANLLWRCYKNHEALSEVTGESYGTLVGIRAFSVSWLSNLPTSVWVAPVRLNGDGDTIGVLALQAYASFEARTVTGAGLFENYVQNAALFASMSTGAGH